MSVSRGSSVGVSPWGIKCGMEWPVEMVGGQAAEFGGNWGGAHGLVVEVSMSRVQNAGVSTWGIERETVRLVEVTGGQAAEFRGVGGFWGSGGGVQGLVIEVSVSRVRSVGVST